MLESVLANDSAELSRLLAQTNPANLASVHSELIDVLTAHSSDFDSGKISLERLLEVVFFPFLKLGAKENEVYTAAASFQPITGIMRIREMMMSAWFEAVQATVSAKEKSSPQGNLKSCVILLRQEKKAELHEALKKENFLQVLSCELCLLLILLGNLSCLSCHAWLIWDSSSRRVSCVRLAALNPDRMSPGSHLPSQDTSTPQNMLPLSSPDFTPLVFLPSYKF